MEIKIKNPEHLRWLYYAIFSVSGFSGLIYESIWTHYLKLFLGHAAYAQALVLAIFMGGMAIGAWTAARYITRISNLFIAYALVEGIIGLFGLGFHSVFQWVITFSYDVAFPALKTAYLVQLYKWIVASALILPQSILLGSTFPIMSNGIIRKFTDRPGSSLAMLYFTNSIGAAIGVLVSGFYLIANVGLPGTILTASVINILLSVTVYLLATNDTSILKPEKASSSISKGLPYLLLASAFITGMASFIYELSWIRMLSMVLSSSSHAFELMLSAFITGLAFGGLWIRKRIDHYDNPLKIAGYIQILMGLFALTTIPLYNYTFDLMSFFMSTLSRTDAGYVLFNFISHLINLLVMIPATFCAGMTLPLFTFILLGKHYGERSIGHIYACNTLGAILGVVFTIFVGMPILTLKGAMLTGTFLDISLGIILLGAALTKIRTRQLMLLVTVCLLVFISTGLFTHFDIKRMASAVYNIGNISITSDTSPLAHFDGSTASISVLEWKDSGVSITTNGKTEASITTNVNEGPTVDEYTMTLLAALPLFLHYQAADVANIGFGSGLTTHALLASSYIKKLDTIEIEKEMVRGAEFFRPKNERAYSDKRSRIYIEDAKTFFHTVNNQYDIIISEPSNPWVSGVSSLFTDEFYKAVIKYVRKDGIFVQWLQTYESNITIILNILHTISVNFSDFQVYAATDGDLIIIASPFNKLRQPDDSIFQNEELKNNLERIGVYNMHDIMIRMLGDKTLLAPLLKNARQPLNSDYFPVVDTLSARARYIANLASEIIEIRTFPVPVIQFLTPQQKFYQQQDATLSQAWKATQFTRKAQAIYKYAVDHAIVIDDISNLSDINLLLVNSSHCVNFNEPSWTNALLNLHMSTVAYLDSEHLLKILKLITPECQTAITENQQHLLDLYLAYGTKNFRGIKTHAGYLLENNRYGNIQHQRYLFASLLLSLVGLNDYDQALQAWNQYSSVLYQGNQETPFPLLMLYNIAASGNN